MNSKSFMFRLKKKQSFFSLEVKKRVKSGFKNRHINGKKIIKTKN